MSQHPRSPSPTPFATAHASPLDITNTGLPSHSSTTFGRSTASSGKVRAHKPRADAATKHGQKTDRSDSLSPVMQAVAAYEQRSVSSNTNPPSLRSSDASTSRSPIKHKPTPISTSRSSNTLVQLDNASSPRLRSKSTAASANSLTLPSPRGAQPSPSTAVERKNADPITTSSKPSLRSRIFGSKSLKVASPITPSFDSGTETPSPRSARFPPSIYSEDSHSDPNLLDSGDARSVERPMPSPSHPASHLALGHDNDDDASEHDTGDTRGDAASSRKSSGTSSFLRKTIRFKDKSAFLKTRPSVSSMASESATSLTTSVPPSPLDSPSATDLDDATRKQAGYRQISGRRGVQYRRTSTDDFDREKSSSPQRNSPSLPPSTWNAGDAPALLPAVDELDLEASSKVRRSASQRAGRRLSQHPPPSPIRFGGTNSPDSGLPSRQQLATPYLESSARGHIPRSSSLQGSLSRSNSAAAASQLSLRQATALSDQDAATVTSPRRRPRSGSATNYSPQIQPRTTSSPAQSSTARRPMTAQGSPSLTSSPYSGLSASDRAMRRASRPKTAESGHTYSGSLSSLRDILLVANAISEEGAVYRTPPNTDAGRFDPARDPAASPLHAASPTDPKRPGLPPKNPLRRQRPSGASVTGSPSASGHSPASAHQAGFFPDASTSQTADQRPLGLATRVTAGIRQASPAGSTPSITDFRTPSSDLPQPSPMDRQTSSDYFRSRDIVRSHDAPLGQTSQRSPRLLHSAGSGSTSPAQASLSSSQHLARAPSTGSTSARQSGRHERSTSDATSSLTDLRSSLGPEASTTSLHSEASSGTKKKKEGTGSKMLAFARDLAHREGSGDQGSTLPSSGTFRLGKSSKSKKSEAASRPIIRRLYDGPLETDAAAAAQIQATENGLPSAMRFTDGVSPGSSAVDLQSSSGALPRTPSTSDTRARSVSSSASTARDFLSPTSGHHLTPQFGSALGAGSIPRSPSFAAQAWSISQDDLSQDQKRLVKRWFVLRELLDTERAYASDLAVARDVYLARAKMRAGITAPLSPLSVRSASVFSQLASPEPTTLGRSSQPHLQQRGSGTVINAGTGTPGARPNLPQRALFRNASADATATASSVDQAASSTSLASSNQSNRSSTYTLSSQSSQTSDTSQFALSGHPAFSGGPPAHFSIDGISLSPTSGVKPHSVAPIGLASTSASPISSMPATPSMSTTSGILSPGFPGPVEGSVAGLPDAPLSAADVRIIFAQLEACAAFADEMVVVLEAAVGRVCSGTAEEAGQLLAQGIVVEESETDRVGQAFLKLMPRIEQVYTAYCSRHEASMARLQELISTQPKVGAFIGECTVAARACTNAWDLSSLLIKPVQRVLKYPLLLKEILASTSLKHPDAEDLSVASAEIQKVADNINEVKKRKDLVDQIVSGKATKRSTSQRIQHGATKKLLRRQEKVKKLVLGPTEDILADDGQYKELVEQFRQLDKATSAFARRCLGWSTRVKDAHEAQLALLTQWCRIYAVDGLIADTEAEHRVHAFLQLVETTFLGEYWSQLDAEIRTSLTPALQRIAGLFPPPQSVIAKRDDREPDYTRYLAEAARGGSKAVDKRLTESANAFIALHMQLMNELPQFNYGIQTLLDLCIESLSRTQASYHLRVHRALLAFWETHGPEGNADIAINEETEERSMRHLNPVKIFWPLHSSIAGFAESMGIVSGLADEPRSRNASVSMESDLLAVGNLSPSSTNHFSPLQAERSLPDPDFASRVPDATSMSKRIESLTAAGSEELLESTTARASPSPSPLATPPLGSRPSLSPQLQQQSLLGSPAPIGSHQQQQQLQPTLRSTKSGGGLIGLLRSVGSSSAVGSRKNPQSTDTATDSFVDALGSDPPTPVSKDTPVMPDSVSAGHGPVAPPTLPALTFNSGFFGQSGTEFSMGASEQRSETDDTARTEIIGTMAAVASSGSRSSNSTRNGYPFLEYSVGDLFRVMEQDGAHLFGHSELGLTGWVERENFVPLA
ncbi:DH domain-containing protein [Pseudozyma hubeiensis]|nr:DH domain-containing protein [Pseudozyma hubeiensis]